MKNLIFTDETLNQSKKNGIVFWQKTGFLRHCNDLGFQSMITLVERKFSPTDVEKIGNSCFFEFDNEEKKNIYLELKKEPDSKNFFIYGEADAGYTDSEFHEFALIVVSYIAKQIGCKFYVCDTTDFIKNNRV